MDDSCEGIPVMTRLIYINQALKALNNNLAKVLHEMHEAVLFHIKQALRAPTMALYLYSHINP